MPSHPTGERISPAPVPSNGPVPLPDPSAEAQLPQRPIGEPLTEQALAHVCGALSEACRRTHELLVDKLKDEKLPCAITDNLSITPSPTRTEGVLSLSEDDRRAFLQLAQESLRASGTRLVGGIPDFIGYANRFTDLSSPGEDRGEGGDSLFRREREAIRAVNALTVRLMVSLTIATSPMEKQLSLVGLSALVHACRPHLNILSADLEDAMNRALGAGAEIPLWVYGQK